MLPLRLFPGIQLEYNTTSSAAAIYKGLRVSKGCEFSARRNDAHRV